MEVAKSPENPTLPVFESGRASDFSLLALGKMLGGLTFLALRGQIKSAVNLVRLFVHDTAPYTKALEALWAA